jgi:hypothetical protein
MLHWGRARIAAAGTALALVAGSGIQPPRQGEAPPPIQTADDPKLEPLLTAAAVWKPRLMFRRQVVDVVCLVPDVPSFFDAIAAWDDQHAFPILIEDVELNLKFLRAFRPARVLRLSGSGRALAESEIWRAAALAVGRSGTSGDASLPPGANLVVKPNGPVPPGLVLSAPGSPSLAGAVALAAGHIEALAPWDLAKTGRDTLSRREAIEAAGAVEARVAALFPDYANLGDDCDFVTLAGDWPDRYTVEDGPAPGVYALDDLLGRTGPSARRYAFVGRLTGGPAQSVYQAMCSLFLQPESALLFNGYGQSEPPWSDFDQGTATERLGKLMPVESRAGPRRANLAGWRAATDPINAHGLVLQNSSGGPARFSVRGGEGRAQDVPSSVPAALYVIHSNSAARPDDPETVGGRWLANGAFVYFGALSEPYLHAFRTPSLVADLLARGVPFGAAVAKLPGEEPFVSPWRLRLIGDPLFRIEEGTSRAARVRRFAAIADWPAYDEPPSLPAEASATERLRWCLQVALLHAARRQGGPERGAWASALLAVDRADLDADQRTIYDALLADLITFAMPSRDYRQWLRPVGDLKASPVLLRAVQAREMRPGRP